MQHSMQNKSLKNLLFLWFLLLFTIKMEIKILKEEKNEMDLQIDNLTIAEIIRVYLNQDEDVKVGAWKREHYSKPAVIKVQTDGKSAKKALQDAIGRIQKDLDKYAEEFKKAK
jgi:DNA-directed RNA polymerase subunit L